MISFLYIYVNLFIHQPKIHLLTQTSKKNVQQSNTT